MMHGENFAGKTRLVGWLQQLGLNVTELHVCISAAAWHSIPGVQWPPFPPLTAPNDSSNQATARFKSGVKYPIC
ncbi:MAG: hypothetical protein Ct9H300mP11_33240 [Chloroflexota bacterium]|nr:MAG: hypothetical protein Ct9H300mP11_33240 [Chloroflexota bacterium]